MIHIELRSSLPEELYIRLFVDFFQQGFMQPQGHVQLLMNLLVRGMDPQAAIDAPRFCILGGTGNGTIAVEQWTSEDDEEAEETRLKEKKRGTSVAEELREMGHSVMLLKGHGRVEVGRAQVSDPKMK